MNKIKKPNHAGIYWAKSGTHQWWNLIIEVVGEVPWLTIGQIYNRDSSTNAPIRDFDITEWGPEIPRPE